MERTAPNNKIAQFRQKLQVNGIAHEYELVGCLDSELVALENKYGQLPDAYKDMMRLLGRRAGKLIERAEFDFYIDQLTKDLVHFW